MTIKVDIVDYQTLYAMGIRERKDGIITKEEFLQGLQRRLNEIENRGDAIISVGYVSGAYASKSALITWRQHSEGSSP